MSDPLKHECGIALLRLLKPLEYYREKYATPIFGFNRLFLMLEKQHNRGQDGAGMGCVKLNMPAGKPFMYRDRDCDHNPLNNIFQRRIHNFNTLVKEDKISINDPQSIKANWEFGGEVFIGHQRYATSGRSKGISVCHPYFRRSNWPTRNLMLAGNFNMTNIDVLHEALVSRGQHPIFETDTQAILELIGYQLDEEHSSIYRELRDQDIPGHEIPNLISDRLNPAEIIRKAAEGWDGGYTMAGLIGNGDAFVMRDPNGIRPGYFYQDEELIAVASERVPLMTVLGVEASQCQELKPAHVFVIKASGKTYSEPFTEPRQQKSCSFERIYFSRGNDPLIYKERKALGSALVKPIMDAVNDDLKNTVFSYIPNTAESGYYGLMEGLRLYRRDSVRASILNAHNDGSLNESLIDELIMDNWPRQEKIAIKDIKLRTFISQETNRLHLASHVYDTTYGVLNKDDTLVCLDDSIVRGTTLKQSILKILSRGNPKKIIIVSTAPQIRYPDCYGIDMSEIGKFVAFQAAILLLKESGRQNIIDDVYSDCLAQAHKPANRLVNHVKRIYDPFTAAEISERIAQIVYPFRGAWHGELQIIFQDIASLHDCLKPTIGDWYFTGNYPTPGGFAILNKAFINYFENRQGRSYELPVEAGSKLASALS